MSKNASAYRGERDELQLLLDSANLTIGSQQEVITQVTADRDLLQTNYNLLEEAFGFLKSERDTLARTVQGIEQVRAQANAPRTYAPPKMVVIQLEGVEYTTPKEGTAHLRIGDHLPVRVKVRRTASGNVGVLSLIGRSTLTVDGETLQGQMPEADQEVALTQVSLV